MKTLVLCCLSLAGAAFAQDLETVERDFARLRAAHEMRFTASGPEGPSTER